MFTEWVSLHAQTPGSAAILLLLSEDEKQSGFPTLHVCFKLYVCS